MALRIYGSPETQILEAYFRASDGISRRPYEQRHRAGMDAATNLLRSILERVRAENSAVVNHRLAEVRKSGEFMVDAIELNADGEVIGKFFLDRKIPIYRELVDEVKNGKMRYIFPVKETQLFFLTRDMDFFTKAFSELDEDPDLFDYFDVPQEPALFEGMPPQGEPQHIHTTFLDQLVVEKLRKGYNIVALELFLVDEHLDTPIGISRKSCTGKTVFVADWNSVSLEKLPFGLGENHTTIQTEDNENEQNSLFAVMNAYTRYMQDQYPLQDPVLVVFKRRNRMEDVRQ